VRFVAATTALLTAVLLLAVTSQFVTAAQPSPLSVGDQLEYAVAVELQQHHVRGTGKSSDEVTESSAQGTATFTIYSIQQDGTALATVALSLQGTNAGQPVAMQTATPGKVLADGQLRIQAQVGLGVSDAFAAANTTIAEMDGHGALIAGKTWTSTTKTPFVAMTMTRTVLADTNYQGRAVGTLQSVGAGSLLRTTDGKPTSGNISVGGTTYYDGQDHLLVGEAFRTLTVVTQPGSTSMHDDYSSTFNVVLNAWNHQSPAPSASAQPTQAESSPEQATPAPTQTPLPPLYSTPYPTPASSSAP
jgi:hypothetical protein